MMRCESFWKSDKCCLPKNHTGVHCGVTPFNISGAGFRVWDTSGFITWLQCDGRYYNSFTVNNLSLMKASRIRYAAGKVLPE